MTTPEEQTVTETQEAPVAAAQPEAAGAPPNISAPSSAPQPATTGPAREGGQRPEGGGFRPSGPPRAGGGFRPGPGQRPGGGRPPGRYAPRRRVCTFCVEHAKTIDYKDVERLRRFISDRAKIEPTRKTGVCAKHQRLLSTAIKRARHIALLPFVPNPSIGMGMRR